MINFFFIEVSTPFLLLAYGLPPLYLPPAVRGTLLKYEKELSLVIGHSSLVKNQHQKAFVNRSGLPAPVPLDPGKSFSLKVAFFIPG
jgi:hypothetical protein